MLEIGTFKIAFLYIFAPAALIDPELFVIRNLRIYISITTYT